MNNNFRLTTEEAIKLIEKFNIIDGKIICQM